MGIRDSKWRYVAVALLCLMFLAAVAITFSREAEIRLRWKSDTANGYLPYHQLQIDDFRVDDGASPGSRIYTAGFFHYDYKYRSDTENNNVIARVTHWVVRSGFDRNKSSRKSWFTPSETDLLHEQGHLDINEIWSKKFAELRLEQLPVGRGMNREEASGDLARKLAGLAEEYSKKAQSEQDAYDSETSHGRNLTRQQLATAASQIRLHQDTH